MSPKDLERFRTALSGLAGTIGFELSQIALTGYWIGLDDLTIEEVEIACALALKRAKFMPKPVELRELIAGPSPADRAQIAWETFTAALSRYGSYLSLDFEDRCINAAVRSLGGLTQVAMLEGEAFTTWARKDFQRAYEAYARLHDPGEVGRYLVGRIEAQNRTTEEHAKFTPPVQKIPCSTARLPRPAALGAGGDVIDMIPGGDPEKEKRST